MDERRDPQTNAPDEGELLAAYLDADTDDITSARLDRLLRRDPQAAARLDALARTRARLQRLDDVAPPEGFRVRLESRLAAERAQSAQTPARGDVQVQPAARWTQRRFAPFAAAAALVLVAVIGGASLLGQSGSSEETAAAPQELQESSRSADTPMAEADDGAPGAAGGDSAEAPASAEAAEEAESFGSTVPRIARDSGVLLRLRRPAQVAEDPAARESQLRERAGLAPEPACVRRDGIDAAAVDLVELDGQLVIAALIDGGNGQDVVLFDALSCERLRTFPAG